MLKSLLHRLKEKLVGNIKPHGCDSSGAPEYAVHYLSHTIPREMKTGQKMTGRIVLQNTGCKTWKWDVVLENRVEIVLRWDGTTVQTFSLPQKEVPPNGTVAVTLDFLAPSITGTHILTIDMVEQNIAFFEDQGVAPLHLLIDVKKETAGTVSLAKQTPPIYSAEYLEHNLPTFASAGTRLGAWITIQNTGSLLWKAIQIDPVNPVDLLVEISGQLVATVHLPVARIRTGEAVVLFFALPLPLVPGVYQIQLSLVRQNDSFFAQHGVAPFAFDITTNQESPSLSSGYFEKGLQVNSWFYMPSHGVDRNSNGNNFPVFAQKAKGYTLWDIEGNRYIDYTMGWGCALLGYGHERVNRAIISALDIALTLPLPHPLLVEVSEMICEDIPSAEMVAFGKNGSDACTLAVRLARAGTGKNKILVCGYHGFQDWFAELVGFENSGVPNRAEPLVYRFRFNDLESFHTLLQRHRHDLAGVMLEPSGPGEDIQGPSQEADPQFLQVLAAETRKVNAVLIFDEIITGFRYLEGSAQKRTGVIPDITCLGKALGNGMPISAVAGKRAIMIDNMSRSFYGPTFKDEILSLAAAKECLAIYRSEPVSRHVWDFGKKMIKEVNSLCKALDLPAAMAGPAFRFALHFQEEEEYRLLQIRTLYNQELLKRGILTYNGIMLPSYAHDDWAYQKTLDALQGSLETVKTALVDGDIHRFIEIPLISR